MRPAACAPRRNNSTELELIMITELVGGGVKIKIKIKTEIAITIKIRESRRHPRENCTQLSGQNPKQPLQPPCLRPLVQLSLLPLLPSLRRLGRTGLCSGIGDGIRVGLHPR